MYTLFKKNKFTFLRVELKKTLLFWGDAEENVTFKSQKTCFSLYPLFLQRIYAFLLVTLETGRWLLFVSLTSLDGRCVDVLLFLCSGLGFFFFRLFPSRYHKLSVIGSGSYSTSTVGQTFPYVQFKF